MILEIGMIYTGLNRSQLDPAAGTVSEIKITSNGAGYLDNEVVDEERFVQLVNAFENPQATVPERFALHPAHPNPFNPVTNIRFDLPEEGYATLVVYDMTGREVTQLVSGVMSAGYHSVQWDASNMASGIYMVRLTAGDYTAVQKVSLLK
jgi:rhodanese-related sulfurtransferase